MAGDGEAENLLWKNVAFFFVFFAFIRAARAPARHTYDFALHLLFSAILAFQFVYMAVYIDMRICQVYVYNTLIII